MSRYLFGGFSRCLYPTQKFQSDAERKLAVILERESLKWFKPAKGQFQLFYQSGIEHLEFQPDFVAETRQAIYILEPPRNPGCRAGGCAIALKTVSVMAIVDHSGLVATQR